MHVWNSRRSHHTVWVCVYVYFVYVRLGKTRPSDVFIKKISVALLFRAAEIMGGDHTFVSGNRGWTVVHSMKRLKIQRVKSKSDDVKAHPFGCCGRQGHSAVKHTLVWDTRGSEVRIVRHVEYIVWRVC